MVKLTLLPIQQHFLENKEFAENPLCQDTLRQNIDYYKVIGFTLPWVAYYAELNGDLVGSGAFKGKPKNGKVEIAYVTFPDQRNQGIGTAMCKELVNIAKRTDPNIEIIATTLPENNFSTVILKKNNFVFVREFEDEEDGLIWEWKHQPTQ